MFAPRAILSSIPRHPAAVRILVVAAGLVVATVVYFRLHAGASTASGDEIEQVSAAAETGLRYRVAVCDWMILKRQNVGAFPLSREIGADGVEVDIGGLGNRANFDNKLVDPAVRQTFLDAARNNKVEIASIAMSAFYQQSFAERENIDAMLKGCFETMKAMGVRVAFLPLGVAGDLVKRPQIRPAIVERLKLAGRMAQDYGVIVGIETSLDAAGEAKLLDEVGSPAVKSYFNISNALQNDRDVTAEIRKLGRKRIVQIHATNTDGVWLEKDPQVNMKQIKATLDDIGWRGWLVVERSRDARRAKDVRYNFSANVTYLKKMFQEK